MAEGHGRGVAMWLYVSRVMSIADNVHAILMNWRTHMDDWALFGFANSNSLLS